MGIGVRAEELQTVAKMLVKHDLQRVIVRITAIGFLSCTAPDRTVVSIIVRMVEGQVGASFRRGTGGVGETQLQASRSDRIKCVRSDEFAAYGADITDSEDH